MDWLYELFWSRTKFFPTTHILDPNDKIPDIGPGLIDCFEYLRTKIRLLYEEIPYKGYENNYYVFHKKDYWRRNIEDLPEIDSVDTLLF